MKQTEDRLSGCQGKGKELDEISKDMGKKSKEQERNIQEIQDTIKQPNLPIRCTEEEKWQVNGIEQIFNQITGDNFPKLRKCTPIQIQEAHRTPARQDLQRNTPQHIIVKTLYRTRENIESFK